MSPTIGKEEIFTKGKKKRKKKQGMKNKSANEDTDEEEDKNNWGRVTVPKSHKLIISHKIDLSPLVRIIGF